MSAQATEISGGEVRQRMAVRGEWALTFLFLLGCAWFLFADAAPAPIALWDESRNIVNALEMRERGLGLVTTYEFAPDHWNTKPPLLIWLMTGSVALFGPSEWALRLPSAVAALATILLVLLFTRRVTGSFGAALFAAAILALSPGFYGLHGARTADYDALLTFFTTAYLCLLFLVFRSRRPALWPMIAIGLLIAAAVLTKSAAGLLPGTGVALYLLAARRMTRVWTGAGALAMTLVAGAPILMFHILREAAAPGYLAAIMHNDTVGRVTQSLAGRDEPLWFYLEDLLTGWFFLGPLLVITPLGLPAVRGKSRALLLYCLCIVAAMLLILTISTTKLPHYLLPAYPFLAIAGALLLRGAYARYWGCARTELARFMLMLAVVLPFALLGARAVYWRYYSLPAHLTNLEGLYEPLFAGLAARGERGVAVWEPGFVLEGRPGYAPILRSYRLLWRQRGFPTALGTDGRILASCDPDIAPRLRAMAPDIGHVPGCAAVRVHSDRS